MKMRVVALAECLEIVEVRAQYELIQMKNQLCIGRQKKKAINPNGNKTTTEKGVVGDWGLKEGNKSNVSFSIWFEVLWKETAYLLKTVFTWSKVN